MPVVEQEGRQTQIQCVSSNLGAGTANLALPSSKPCQLDDGIAQRGRPDCSNGFLKLVSPLVLRCLCIPTRESLVECPHAGSGTRVGHGAALGCAASFQWVFPPVQPIDWRRWQHRGLLGLLHTGRRVYCDSDSTELWRGGRNLQPLRRLKDRHVRQWRLPVWRWSGVRRRPAVH